MQPVCHKKHYTFFAHRQCEFYPCHPAADPENFNCLFCYCPLYSLGEACGGNYTLLPDGTKDCTHCLVPHLRENYDRIVARLTGCAAPVRQPERDQPGKEFL